MCLSLCVDMSVSPYFPEFSHGSMAAILSCHSPVLFSPPRLSNNDSLICQPITPERYLNEPIRTCDRMTGCSS